MAKNFRYKMFWFIKKCFFTGLEFSSTLTSVNLLSCISVNNQECKVRPQSVNVNEDDPVFLPFSIKTSKCNSSYDNINNAHAKLCVPDIVKNLHVKVFHQELMKQDTECHETFKCRLDAGICNNKQPWNGDKCRYECEELLDKGVCDKDFIWNPSNCECECDKSCDIGEFLDYKNCKCRKRLINKLVDECTENVEEVKLAKITSAKYENMHKCSSCTLYIVLFSIIFTINVGIGTYFVYFYWYSKKDVTCVKFGFRTQTTI